MNPDYKMICFERISDLRYVMAGDMESVELLSQLDTRRRSIHWDDPAFTQLSQEMRAPVPSLTPEQEGEFRPALVALLHLQMETTARDRETISTFISQTKTMVAQQEQMRTHHAKVFAIAKKLAATYSRMRDELEMLGVDTSEYTLPPELFL